MIQILTAILSDNQAESIDKITKGSYYSVIDGPTYNTDNSPINPTNQRPGAWYHTDGCTYFTFQKNNIAYSSVPLAGKYDPSTQQVTIVDTGLTSGNTNYHNSATCRVDDDGRMYIITEMHGQKIKVFKSDNDNGDISAWTEIANLSITPGDKPAYPNIYRVGSDYYMLFRNFSIADDDWTTHCYKGTNGLDSWTYHAQIAECLDEGGFSDIRLYNQIPVILPKESSTWKYFGIEKRFASTVTTYRYKFFFKTQDFITIHNYQDTFSKDIVTNGAITDAELKANFMYFDGGDYTTEYLRASVYVLSEDEKPYMRVDMPDNTYRVYYYDGGWTFFTNADVPMNDIIYTDGTSFKQYPDVNDEYNMYKSSNFGDSTAESIFKIATQYPDPVKLQIDRYIVPSNYWDIPAGTEFISFISSDRDSGGVDNPENSDLILTSLIKNV